MAHVLQKTYMPKLRGDDDTERVNIKHLESRSVFEINDQGHSQDLHAVRLIVVISLGRRSTESIFGRMVRAFARNVARVSCHLPCDMGAVGFVSKNASQVLFSLPRASFADLDQGVCSNLIHITHSLTLLTVIEYSHASRGVLGLPWPTCSSK